MNKTKSIFHTKCRFCTKDTDTFVTLNNEEIYICKKCHDFAVSIRPQLGAYMKIKK